MMQCIVNHAGFLRTGHLDLFPMLGAVDVFLIGRAYQRELITTHEENTVHLDACIAYANRKKKHNAFNVR